MSQFEITRGKRPVNVSVCGKRPVNVSACGKRPVNVSVCGKRPVNVSACGNRPVNVSVCGKRPVNVSACSKGPQPMSRSSPQNGFRVSYKLATKSARQRADTVFDAGFTISNSARIIPRSTFWVSALCRVNSEICSEQQGCSGFSGVQSLMHPGCNHLPGPPPILGEGNI